MSAANPIVAIFASTDEILTGDPYNKYFLPALTNNIVTKLTIDAAVSAGDDYDTDSVKNILTVAQTLDQNADLIVTLGGLVAAEAVAKLKTKDYPNAVSLVLVGNAPKHGSALEKKNGIPLMGGIDLESTTLNPARVTALLSNFKSVTDRTKICLYYNQNSHMIQEELTEWNFHVDGYSLQSTANQAKANYDPKAFGADFADLPKDTQAVVISSDPFFAAKASDLAAAANTWGKPVCYPTSAFTVSKTSIVSGPNLNLAYQALGNKANQYLVAFMKKAAPSFLGFDVQPAAALRKFKAAKKKTSHKKRR
jgi:hypothetical protein